MLDSLPTRRLWQQMLQPWGSRPPFQQVTPPPLRPKQRGALWWIGAGLVILNPGTLVTTSVMVIALARFGAVFGLREVLIITLDGRTQQAAA